jgi:ribosomal protein L40E
MGISPARNAPAPSETWKCRDCGATNRARAEWCGQCFATRTAPAEDVPAPAAPPSEVATAEPPASLEEALMLVAKKSSASGRGTSSQPAAPEDSGVVQDSGSFRVQPEGISWVCKWCETRNPLAEQRCSVCGASFADVLKEEKVRPARDPGVVALLSLFLPGAGHAYMGLWGQAVARAVISLWAVLVCFFAAVQGGRGMLLAIVFGVIAFALWVIAAHDGYREASGSPALALIKSNHFLFLVLGLLGVQITVAFVVALSAS